jgi:hypothetical protein
VSKRDMGSKLKARLDEWEAYGEKPVLIPELVTTHDRRRMRDTVGPDFTAGFAAAPVRGTARLEIPVQVDPIVVLPESRGDELQVALEHDRDQSMWVSDAVEREQLLHAVAHEAQAQHRSGPRGGPEPVAWEPERPRNTYGSFQQSSGSPYFALIVLTLVIAVIAYGVVYLLTH